MSHGFSASDAGFTVAHSSFTVAHSSFTGGRKFLFLPADIFSPEGPTSDMSWGPSAQDDPCTSPRPIRARLSVTKLTAEERHYSEVSRYP